MDCDFIVRDDLAERYLRGELSAADQEAYELHFFECQRCFGELSSLQAIQDAMREIPAVAPAAKKRIAWNPWWRWLSTGAVAASLVGVVLLLQHRAPVLEPTATNQLPAAAARSPGSMTVAGSMSGQRPAAAAGAEVSEAPATPPQGSSKSPGVAWRRAEVLARLARVEPPRYSASVLRGATDEATLRFQDGMSAYTARNYAVAVQKLHDAAVLDPSRPDIAFFLGASKLLSGDATGAVGELRQTIAMGDTPFLEEAHFYLAKAYLKQGDAESAHAQLETVKAMHGEKSSTAGELLAQLANLPAK